MRMRTMIVGAVLLVLGIGIAAQAQESPEVKQLKSTVEQLQKTVQQLHERLASLEKEKSVQAAKPAPPAVQPTAVQASAGTALPEGNASPVTLRESMGKEEQAGAPRLDDLTLDPKYHGFFAIPNTNVIMQLNAKPHFDMFRDSRYSGDDSRFVTAKIPIEGTPEYGGGSQVNANAKASNLSWDVRAPLVPGSPRFFLQADFFGSESPKLDVRWKQLYAQYYNFVFGQTITLFEDPDIWPDTVDYEGPNSMIFSRVAAAHYIFKLSPNWNMTVGLERPDSQVADYYGETNQGLNRWPDTGFNLRWEKAKVGHIQFAGMLRDIGVRNPTWGDHHALGWGANLSAVFDVAQRDSIQAQLTYGEGIGRYSNDAFSNMDAAFTDAGKLQPLPYFGGFFGYTHGWSDKLRTTLSYGYVHLTDELSMGPTAYHRTDYASLNVVYQFHKKMSFGWEVLWGQKQQLDLKKGDVWRAQFGIVYKLF